MQVYIHCASHSAPHKKKHLKAQKDARKENPAFAVNFQTTLNVCEIEMLFISKYLPFLPAHGIRKVRLKFVPGFVPRFRSFIISSADEASEFSSRARQASAGEKPAEKRGARRTGSQAPRIDPLTRRSRQRRKCPRAEPAARATGRGAKRSNVVGASHWSARHPADKWIEKMNEKYDYQI